MRDTVFQGVLGLQPNEIHIHLLRLENEALAGLEKVFLPFLASEEREAYFDQAGTGRQPEFLASRALLRLVLAFYTGEDPQSFRYGRQKFGKPYLENSELQFSLSHTENLVACSVGFRRIGVDVEKGGILPQDWERIARRFFSSAEQHYLFARDKHLQPHVFLQIFTLKEAVAKADGRGLSLPWNGFSVPLPDGGRPMDGSWDYFTRYLEGENAWLAHAAENPVDQPMDHRLWMWEPASLEKWIQSPSRLPEGTHGYFRR